MGHWRGDGKDDLEKIDELRHAGRFGRLRRSKGDDR